MKTVTVEQALEHIKEGMTIMIGGFLSNGTPESLVDGIVERKIGNLTIISNDGGTPGTGVAKLIAAGLVKKLIATHIGMNPEVGQLMNKGSLELELVPQGTMAERIRAGGAGLGGVLTKTGMGTEVADGKQSIMVDGQEYLLEKPLHGDVALLRGSVVDESGNTIYYGTSQNFNPVMATAADLVIAEAAKLVPVGEIKAEQVVTPGIFIDYIVSPNLKRAADEEGGKHNVG